jgi:multicomponent Na+:H+ antiporter subunit C
VTPYLVLAAVLFVLGLHGLFVCRHPLRKILALNVLTTAVFLLLVTVARLAEPLDPVPHAMVLTGIVVTVSTTAVALALAARLAAFGRGTGGKRRTDGS